MDRWLALVITLAVGGLVALQAPGNALLARLTGDLGAAFASLVLSTLIVGVLLVATGGAGELGGLSAVRPVHLVGGIGGAGVVLITLITVRTLGAGGVAAALVVSQLAVSVLADRLGWLGLDGSPIGPAKVAGVVLLLAGTVLVTAS